MMRVLLAVTIIVVTVTIMAGVLFVALAANTIHGIARPTYIVNTK